MIARTHGLFDALKNLLTNRISVLWGVGAASNAAGKQEMLLN
jgi:hypothetical protein